jgi:hypothetical protein
VRARCYSGLVGRGERRFALVVLAGVLCVLGASTALARRGAPRPIAFKITTRIPQPGLFSATVFKLTLQLRSGARPPHQLSIRPVSRGRLPAGVAVVATDRLLRNSRAGFATYVGVVAAFRPLSARGAADSGADPGAPDERDAISLILAGGGAFVHGNKEVEDVVDTLVPLFKVKVESSPQARATLGQVLGREAFDDGHAFAWGVALAPSASRADDGIVADAGHLARSGPPDPKVMRELEIALDGRFAGEFPDGSLFGDGSGGRGAGVPMVPTTYAYKLDISVASGAESFMGSTPDTEGVTYSGSSTSMWSGVWDVQVYIDPVSKLAQLYIPQNGDPDYRMTGSSRLNGPSGSSSSGSFTCPGQPVGLSSSFPGLQVGVNGGGSPSGSVIGRQPTSYASTGSIEIATVAPNGGNTLSCSAGQGQVDFTIAPSVFAGIGSNLCGAPAMKFSVAELGADIHFNAPFSYASPSSTDPAADHCAGLYNPRSTRSSTVAGTYAVDMHYQGRS